MFRGTYMQKHWLATDDEVVNGTIYGFMVQDNDGQLVYHRRPKATGKAYRQGVIYKQRQEGYD